VSRKNVFPRLKGSAPASASSVDGEFASQVGPEKIQDLMSAAGPQRIAVIGALGRMLDGIAEDSARTEEIQRELASSERVIMLAPELVEPSPIRDRIADPNSPDEEQFRAAIARDGQRVPILVRPHPERSGRFLAVYGHRRLEAAKHNGQKVRAIVLDLSDEEALVAQGQENNERKSTSFIERCLYAKRMKAAGLKVARIAGALSVPHSLVSMQVAIAESLPEALILAIGPAPDIGRPRWQALVALIEADPDGWRPIVATPEFAVSMTNDRFNAVLERLSNKPKREVATKPVRLSDQNGLFATVRRTGRLLTYSISIDDKKRPDGLSFADWMEARFPQLREEYLDGR
jgi:ParB family chromosome partitioning protein